MKNIISVFSLISLITISLNAQTKTEREVITKNYNFEAINQLKEELETSFLVRENKILDYLKRNNKSSKNIIVKGKTYNIYDIVNGHPVYRTTHSLNSAKSTKTDKLQTGGNLGLNLDGTNMVIAVWDEESVRGTHVEFEDGEAIPVSRVIYPEFPNGFFGPISDHATHVAGILIAKGTDVNAKGMAPKATLRSFDWGLDDQEALTEAANGLLISNHSYGVPIYNSSNVQQVDAKDIGSYSTDARAWDQVSFQSPYYLAVNSAGNDGSETYTGGLGVGYDKLTGNKTAKNILVVANANPSVHPEFGTLINFPINTSSSQGPTDDFRIKPDIAGDGTNVYSSTSGSNTQYSTFSGTSMASPNVAGTLLLLQEYYNRINASYMKAATLKGLVCHTAIDNASRIGPDPIFGWGLLDAEASALVIQGNSNGTAVIKELTLNDKGTYTYQFSASANGPVSATICWTDPAGTVSSSLNNVLTPRLVNDLDIRIENENSTVFFPWKLNTANVAGSAIKGDNTVDNIERIDIPTPSAGNYTLTVTHKGSLTNGSQAFSLIVTGSDLTLSATQKPLDNIVVWPNPAGDILNFRFKPTEPKIKIRLYNILGKVIYQKEMEINNSVIEEAINTGNFLKGIYFLNIQNGNGIYNRKILIR
ncbi:C5a peptidase precursor [Mariniflexile rhizosphaerae]|uniref:S8 family serine peptidase n=1 Tax=unclassified Mariniflexile TaxID=2643887 RepID=UPI000CBF4849|nr:S8 family serine peptidase [Mariniflexile sp. TRM1-10]AXP79594.1 C5a peptidase precursor [Mariniflexile sp. TRM1-10]PLB18570.1 MAG: Peptidase S8 and S53, subtilisin, kexin, sedolisin [Flavobacteriaceae bacterium FS1-H7996/R]